jgi:hypothetical protein
MQPLPSRRDPMQTPSGTPPWRRGVSNMSTSMMPLRVTLTGADKGRQRENDHAELLCTTMQRRAGRGWQSEPMRAGVRASGADGAAWATAAIHLHAAPHTVHHHTVGPVMTSCQGDFGALPFAPTPNHSPTAWTKATSGQSEPAYGHVWWQKPWGSRPKISNARQSCRALIAGVCVKTRPVGNVQTPWACPAESQSSHGAGGGQLRVWDGARSLW